MCLVDRIRLTRTITLSVYSSSTFTDTTFSNNEVVLDTSHVGWVASEAGALLATTSSGQYPYTHIVNRYTR